MLDNGAVLSREILKVMSGVLESLQAKKARSGSPRETTAEAGQDEVQRAQAIAAERKSGPRPRN